MVLRAAGRTDEQVARAGDATVIMAKGINLFGGRTRKSEAGPVIPLSNNGFLFITGLVSLNWVAPRETPLVPVDERRFALIDRRCHGSRNEEIDRNPF
jgi:hypothetical protein